MSKVHRFGCDCYQCQRIEMAKSLLIVSPPTVTERPLKAPGDLPVRPIFHEVCQICGGPHNLFENEECAKHEDAAAYLPHVTEQGGDKGAEFDRAYALGFQAGWNAGVNEDNGQLARVMSRLAPDPTKESQK